MIIRWLFPKLGWSAIVLAYLIVIGGMVYIAPITMACVAAAIVLIISMVCTYNWSLKD